MFSARVPRGTSPSGSSLSYQVSLKPSAAKELDRLPPEIFHRIQPRLVALGAAPRPFGVQKLRGRDDAYRIRVGDYRILYAIDDHAKQVTIMSVAHRGEAYR